ncbi:hypothetical protein KYC5002_38470 [Archangium violaceum]|uniref:hypothetical protein n=1 Tax=Archangium violaceum TaxID=83451 RepID=UPI002B2E7ED2|nr:hypothetical protein KYC5002_38470 [Archangium gephyra]
MSKRIVTAVALIGAAGIISGCALEQPSAGCIVQDSTDYPWQAVYVLKNGDATKSCGQLKGEALGVWKYVQFTKDEKTQQLTKVSSKLALRPEGLAARFEPVTYDDEVLNADGSVKVDANGEAVFEEITADRVPGARNDDYSIAKLSTALSETLADEPDEKGLCSTSGFKPATVTTTAVTRTDEESGEVITVAAAESLSYAFTDVKVYSDPSAPGTQLTGTLKYSDGPGCEAEYTVLALWPQVECDPDAFASPTEANAADRCDVGSGLNPDFDAVCVAGIGPGGAAACVPNPATGVPAFKKK